MDYPIPIGQIILGDSFALLPPDGERVLFILAHPGDADFPAGGTIRKLAAGQRSRGISKASGEQSMDIAVLKRSATLY